MPSQPASFYILSLQYLTYLQMYLQSQNTTSLH
nr:MAG TPA: hypothetical protein [Caudoviricetes sp.]